MQKAFGFSGWTVLGFVRSACTLALVLIVAHLLVLGLTLSGLPAFGVGRHEVYQIFSGGRPALNMLGSPVRHFRIVPSRKLMFCDISKNANQAFSSLLCSLLRNDQQPRWVRRIAAELRTYDDFEQGCTWTATSARAVGLTEAQVLDAFSDREWTSAVFVRDPLERFLSGYRSKCEPGHDPDREVCFYCFGNRDATFAEAVAVINNTLGDAIWKQVKPHSWDGTAEDHFRLQSSFCNGLVGQGGFDAYYLLTRETARRDVADMLARAGVTDPAAAALDFEYHFPKPKDTDLLSSHLYGGGVHATGASSAPIRDQYFSSPALVAAVLRHYAPDYRNIPGLQVPRWAVEKVGTAFVRELGLEAD